MDLWSSAFNSGDTIPRKYTCQGDNVSPPLAWGDEPDGTVTYTLIMDDPDASDQQEGPFAHWVLYNIPAGIYRLAEYFQLNELEEAGITTGRNSLGNTQYEGPCPPRGASHRYYFRLYAVDEQLDLTAGATREQVIDRMKGHILENTELIGSYQRS